MTITATDTDITLTGPMDALASLNIEGQIIDFTAYVNSLTDITTGTPYTATLNGFDTEADAFTVVIPVANRQNWQSITNYLKTLGFTGSHNEIIINWLNSEGYTGGFNVAFYDYWEVTEGLEGSFTDKFGAWRQ
jgi:hypothetical protein